MAAQRASGHRYSAQVDIFGIEFARHDGLGALRHLTAIFDQCP
jgi:hypothetical protein